MAMMLKPNLRPGSRKRPSNVSLSSHLLDEAKSLGVNISQACERGLEDQIRATRSRLWLESNTDAIESSNSYVGKHGLPLARHRRF
jgi:antitoxin CcdA